MPLQLVFLDYETYWDSHHSLTKMSAIEYVMHPDTEIQSCSIKVGFDEPAKTYFGEDDIRKRLSEIDWDNAFCIAHNNSEFDAMITAWRFGFKPKRWGCTLAMARPIHAKQAGGSLKALAEHYGLQAKGSLETVNTKGKYLKDFTDEEKVRMVEYNDADTEICAQLFKCLMKEPTTTRRELDIIHMTISMLTDVQFNVDVDLLERGLKAERGRKQKVLRSIGEILYPDVDLSYEGALTQVQSQLKSTAQFKRLLESLNVPIPMKTSPSTGKKIPALAKTDLGFLKLREHPVHEVQAAVEARLDTQSSILESRIDRFIKVANLCGGKMPVALRYYGADTTGRWSGTMKLNQQNLPRVGKNAQISDVLRKSLIAPDGYKVVVADLSGIELRVNMFLWKVPYAVDLFTKDPENADLYKYFSAHTLYNVAESDVTKEQRQVGKVSHLGLGFGAGGATFKDVAKLMGGVDLTEPESFEIVNAYRTAHPEVQQGWRTCHNALEYIYNDSEFTIDPWGFCTTTPEGISTPKGYIRYPNLRQEVGADGRVEWKYGTGRRTARIYAGKITENIVQHLARNIIADMALDIASTDIGKHYPLAHTVHDELIYVVKEGDAQEMLDTVQSIMRTPPTWWPELKTWSEGDIAQTYGDAK